jgi:hypothetical protein
MVFIYQPPNVHVWILLRNAMAAALKNIYIRLSERGLIFIGILGDGSHDFVNRATPRQRCRW